MKNVQDNIDILTSPVEKNKKKGERGHKSKTKAQPTFESSQSSTKREFIE